MAAQTLAEGLKELRGLRDEVAEAQKVVDRATKVLQRAAGARDKKVQQLGMHEQAKAERLAPAAGLSVKDIVDLVPALAPQPATAPIPSEPSPAGEDTTAQPAAETGTGATPPALPQVQPHQDSRNDEDESRPAKDAAEPAVSESPSADGAQTEDETEAAEPRAAESLDEAPAQDQPMRELPSIPEGPAGDRWFAVASNLASEHPNFTQQVRPAVFLDATTGVLAFRDTRYQLDLGSRSAAEILTAVYATVPESVGRIYITAGDPWHRDADRHRYLKDAVAAWLGAPLPEGWQVDSGRGKDDQAGHYVHERKPVGRWQRGNLRTEIRSVTEWFDPEGADVGVIRHAFVLTLQALQKTEPKRFPDAVLMGSPSQTGRDLWSRTIPTKTGSRWADGYPVLSAEIRQLLHATSGQGRTELITPPRITEELPRWTELDRTLAYGKHTWASGVGAPQRVTAHTFDSMSEKDKTNALFAPSHWQVKVTIPDDWNHVGLLPAAVEGDRSWTYPHESGRTFVTWAGGAEINAALRNPIQPWKIEILDGLLWEAGAPLREWSDKLKDAWAELSGWAQAAGSDELRQAYRLASRAVRSILLYGIGSFAQRPRVTTGQVPLGQEQQIPKGAHVVGLQGESITWERSSMSRNPWAHPEWAAGVWSAARAALLSTRAKNADGSKTHVGALHLPPGSIIAFRTDAIYTSETPNWAYNRDPGDYLLKGHLPYAVAAPTNEQEFYGLQANGRGWLINNTPQ
jgi:hypothetical protein